jgi:glutamate formiminotransferase
MLECVVNISEGRSSEILAALDAVCGTDLLDRHTDPDHHRSVFTLLGEEAPRALATAAVERLDLRSHEGAHPRLGVVDVVPFVPLGSSTLADAVAARDRFCSWAGERLALPCFRYGPERTLPELRRAAFAGLDPDCGPSTPHPSAGGCAVGARGLLVAYNLWLSKPDLPTASAIAKALRSPTVRALALRVGSAVQVSMNLVEPLVTGPADVFDIVAARASIERAELVGLVPEAVLAAIPEERWTQLDLARDRTIESRLATR